MSSSETTVWTMDFPRRLAALRKQKGLTQKDLAEAISASTIQIHRYESGSSQPTLDVIRRLARTLAVSADELIFDDEERGPSDDLRYQFEAIAQFDPEDRRVAKDVLDGLILKNQAKRLASGGEA